MEGRISLPSEQLWRGLASVKTETLGRWTAALQPWPAGSTGNPLGCPQPPVCSEQPGAAAKSKTVWLAALPTTSCSEEGRPASGCKARPRCSYSPSVKTALAPMNSRENVSLQFNKRSNILLGLRSPFGDLIRVCGPGLSTLDMLPAWSPAWLLGWLCPASHS